MCLTGEKKRETFGSEMKPHLPIPKAELEKLPTLTPYRAEFVKHLLAGATGAQAVRLAYPRASRWKASTIQHTAWRAKASPAVRQWIAAAQRIRLSGLTVDGYEARLEALYERALEQNELAVARQIAKDQAEAAGVIVKDQQPTVQITLNAEPWQKDSDIKQVEDFGEK